MKLPHSLSAIIKEPKKHAVSVLTALSITVASTTSVMAQGDNLPSMGDLNTRNSTTEQDNLNRGMQRDLQNSMDVAKHLEDDIKLRNTNVQNRKPNSAVQVALINEQNAELIEGAKALGLNVGNEQLVTDSTNRIDGEVMVKNNKEVYEQADDLFVESENNNKPCLTKEECKIAEQEEQAELDIIRGTSIASKI